MDSRNNQMYMNGNATEMAHDTSTNRQSSDSRTGRKRSQEREKGRSRSRTNSNKGHRTCKKCGEPLTGQFVRALGGTFHLDCFKCRDCGQIVASKFFPVDEDDGSSQFPLCETDYFRRLDLLCYECGGALRGSYITALDRKYHIEHFTCSVCPTIFGAQDSYYEHDGKVYCHYHYSTQFAQRCNGCQTAILKQFVEIFRNGQNQHWHPECYMIHKFWNVKLAPGGPVLPRPDISLPVSNDQREYVKEDEREWKKKSTGYGAYYQHSKSLQHPVFLTCFCTLATLVVEHGLKELAYGREAKLLCKKVVAFFTLLSKTQETGVRKLGVTQELLSLVTGLAHYLKLLIRIGLQGALKLEREKGTTKGINAFLDELADLETIKENEMKSLDLNESTAGLANQESDCCAYCTEPIDDECVMIYGKRWHAKPPHLKCSTCKRDLTHDLASAVYSEREDRVYCINHSARAQETVSGLSHVTKLQQYVFLLKVALARLLEVLKSGGTLPHTSEDPNLNPYDNGGGHRLSPQSERERRMDPDRNRMLGPRENCHPKSLPCSRQWPGSPTGENDSRYKNQFKIIDDRAGESKNKNSLIFGANQDGLTLDDIPRIVAAEQAKEQRPNASRFAGENLLSRNEQPKLINPSQRRSTGQDLLSNEPPTLRTKRYFSELSALEYLIVRTVAVITMQPLLESNGFTMEELLGLIEQRKTTFWGKVSKALRNEPKNKKKGVFGITIESLVEKEGAESTNGVGPGALKVPAIVDDCVAAMRQMDMSVEGVFRKTETSNV
ncbi:hypothetical protein MRB53_039185 [Persea americana]|nr:hypothetical protein MRB53_039185 [Persea americana]